MTLKNLRLFTATLGFILLASQPGIAEPSAPDAAEIKATLDSFHQALATGDEARVISLLLPEALIAESGEVQTRAEYESHHLAADIAFAQAVPGKLTSRMVQQVGQAAWVTTTYRVAGTFRSKTIDEVAAETAVVIQTADGWRISGLHWSSHKAARK